MDGYENKDYPERLRCLGLPTLNYRRHRGDMIEIWKHFNLYEKDILPTSFRPLTRPSRQHNLQLFVNRPSDGERGVQKNSFYYRTAPMWNGLPRHVAEAASINSFKNQLDNHWKNCDFKFDPTKPAPLPTYNQLELPGSAA